LQYGRRPGDYGSIGLPILPGNWRECARNGKESRRQYRLKVPDSVIAATALFTGSTLLTRNTRDFRRIPNFSVLRVWISRWRQAPVFESFRVRVLFLDNLDGATPSDSWSDSAASAIRIPGLSVTPPVLERELRLHPHRELPRSGAGGAGNGVYIRPARSRTPLVGYSPPF